MAHANPPVVKPEAAHDFVPEGLGLPQHVEGTYREVIDLALLAIDGLSALPKDKRADEEQQVKELLGELDADEQQTQRIEGWLQQAADTGEVRYETLARLMGVPRPEAQEDADLSGAEITDRLEVQSFVKEAPKFSVQLEDESRDEVTFTYDNQTFRDDAAVRGKQKYQTTELKGLRQLSGFLGDFIRKASTRKKQVGFETLQATAKSMRDNLTFIGAKELDEGTTGLGRYWAEHLRQSEVNQVCVLTSASLSERRGEKPGVVKSDDFIKDMVFERMRKDGVPEDAMKRIITDPREITGDTNGVKIVFLDDWTVSGRQMGKKIQSAVSRIPASYRDKIELNVVAAPTDLIDKGLDVGAATGSVPVRAYYQAHRAPANASEGVRCHITGTHSTVNFGFSVQIEEMQKLLNGVRAADQRPIAMPAVASVYRPYWSGV